MFDSPVYRWLPAKSKIASRFLMFYVPSSEGMSRVDDVRAEDGKIIVEVRAAGKTPTLAASLAVLDGGLSHCAGGFDGYLVPRWRRDRIPFSGPLPRNEV